jgi:hypothetical protein
VLNFYTTQVQRLLHDLSFQYWPQPELTDYINEARYRVAQDTNCLRQVVTGMSLTAQQESYQTQALIAQVQPTLAPQLVGIQRVYLYWGTQRLSLGYIPFDRMSAWLRPWQTYYQRPTTFSRVGANLIYFAPNPDQVYTIDMDVSVIPNALTSDATVEQIPVPFQEPVQYYAAYKAKWKEQAQGEAEIFKQQYLQTLAWCYRGFQRTIVPSAYRTGR